MWLHWVVVVKVWRGTQGRKYLDTCMAPFPNQKRKTKESWFNSNSPPYLDSYFCAPRTKILSSFTSTQNRISCQVNSPLCNPNEDQYIIVRFKNIIPPPSPTRTLHSGARTTSNVFARPPSEQQQRNTAIGRTARNRRCYSLLTFLTASAKETSSSSRRTSSASGWAGGLAKKPSGVGL